MWKHIRSALFWTVLAVEALVLIALGAFILWVSNLLSEPGAIPGCGLAILGLVALAIVGVKLYTCLWPDGI
jgi:hypothetical protein